MERDSSLNTQTKGGEFAMELPLVSDFLTTVRLATAYARFPGWTSIIRKILKCALPKDC